VREVLLSKQAVPFMSAGSSLHGDSSNSNSCAPSCLHWSGSLLNTAGRGACFRTWEKGPPLLLMSHILLHRPPVPFAAIHRYVVIACRWLPRVQPCSAAPRCSEGPGAAERDALLEQQAANWAGGAAVEAGAVNSASAQGVCSTCCQQCQCPRCVFNLLSTVPVPKVCVQLVVNSASAQGVCSTCCQQCQCPRCVFNFPSTVPVPKVCVQLVVWKYC
jgi:hypothetical protein